MCPNAISFSKSQECRRESAYTFFMKQVMDLRVIYCSLALTGLSTQVHKGDPNTVGSLSYRTSETQNRRDKLALSNLQKAGTATRKAVLGHKKKLLEREERATAAYISYDYKH